MAFELEVPHPLSPEDARARLRALGEYLGSKYGLSLTWTGEDEARVTGSYLVVSIDGTIRLSPGRVQFSGKDPGMLWRGKARDYLTAKLARYLDPKNAVADLPRG